MPLPKSEWIWFDGQFVPWNEAQVHVTTHALHYGSSVFEGLRAYPTPAGPAVLGLDAHIQRMLESCRVIRLEVPYSAEQLKENICATVARNQHKSCYIRPLIFRGSDTFSLDARSCPTQMAIITFEWGRYLGDEAVEQGVDVMVSSWRRMAPGTFPAMAKVGGNYVNSQLIAMEASDNGYIEGIALDVQGFVSEGSGENVFLVYRGAIYTPPIGASILQGVNRGFAITLAHEFGYEVREQMVPREMLYVAEEIFFTGTAAEITPVRSVDRLPVGSGSRGPITQRLQEEFFALATGRKPDRYGWLTIIENSSQK